VTISRVFLKTRFNTKRTVLLYTRKIWWRKASHQTTVTDSDRIEDDLETVKENLAAARRAESTDERPDRLASTRAYPGAARST